MGRGSLHQAPAEPEPLPGFYRRPGNGGKAAEIAKPSFRKSDDRSRRKMSVADLGDQPVAQVEAERTGGVEQRDLQDS